MSKVAARSPQYETLASGVPAPSLRELGGLTSESGGSGGIGVDGRVTEVMERSRMGLEVMEVTEEVWRLRRWVQSLRRLR